MSLNGPGGLLQLTDADLLRNRPQPEKDQSSRLSIPSSLRAELPGVVSFQKLLNGRSESDITFSDGLSGALFPPSRHFITSPNSHTLAEPPMGSTRDLYRRSDARYGPDDPIRWPQPFNPRYPFLAAISKRPSASLPSEDTVMWNDLEEDDLTYSHARKEGVVKADIIKRLRERISALQVRVNGFYASLSADKQLLIKENGGIVDVCLVRLRDVPSTLREQQRGLVELQRGYLTICAVLDYQVKVHTSDTPDLLLQNVDVDRDKMGAFVYNDADAQFLYRAGFPVYYVRDYSSFDRQVIQKVVTLQRPIPPVIQTSPADPPYNPIATTQAGSDDKFAAIRIGAIQCFVTPDPFSNLHLPTYASSYQVGSGRIMAPALSPSSTSSVPTTLSAEIHARPAHPRKAERSKHHYRKPPVNPPKPQRDLFDDLPADDPMVPPFIPAWANVNHTIKRGDTKPQKRLLIAPDPGLFFGLVDKNRQLPMFTMWHHLRTPWFHRVQAQPIPMLHSVDVWRKACSYMLIKPLPNDLRINQKQEAVLEGQQLVEDTCKLANVTNRPQEMHLECRIICKLIRELCLINFQHDLTRLDTILDSSRPQPQPDLSSAEYEVAKAAHQLKRRTLIADVLGYNHLVPPENTNVGLASTEWPERYSALKSFWTLMNTWQGEKSMIWRRGVDTDIGTFTSGVQADWERMLAVFYVQSFFNVFGYPPSLPRRL